MTKRQHEHDIFWENDYMIDPKTHDIIDPLIYECGGVIHFSSKIDKISIEILIKLMSKSIDKFYKSNSDDVPYELVYIVDTPGGSVNSILKFVDYIDIAKKKYPNLTFTSIISGMVASAGTTMCVVADKRCMTKNAHAMIHELSSGNIGRYTQLISYTDFLKKLHKCLMDIYLKKTNISPEKLEELLKNDTWYNAQEYLNEGFIDEIR